MDSKTMSGLTKFDISDHFAIFYTIKANEKHHSNNVTSFKKDINKDTITDFKNLLKNTAWADA